MTRTQPPEEAIGRDAWLDRIAGAMLRDQRRLREALDRAWPTRRGGSGDPGALGALEGRIERSASLRRARQESVPQVRFPRELPVSQRIEEIGELTQKNQVVVVCGETGSGKSTQLPKLCLSLGRGVGGMIGVTQPRRIAARAIASRVADELGQRLGESVGFKVRFGDRTGAGTHIKVMTDGVLLAEVQQDRLLEQYDTLIIDEAHERSLNIDFLLGYLRRLLPRRPDLKLIVTSATIDPERFAEHFASESPDGERTRAPVIEVSGRLYPVDVRYRPLTREEGAEADEDEPDLQEAILGAIEEVATGPAGDVLVFLSGEREIRETAENLRKRHPASTEVLPLYARLSVEEQQRIFRPHTGRRIVLATNIAETSLTVPGIRYVVDPGFARISRYSPRSKVQRLPIEPVSRSSADQRAGRCGRVEAGVCVRLYSEEDYEQRPRFTDPEILRTNLASVILQMLALRLGRIEDFPFLDRPESRAVRDAYETLEELGAVEGHGSSARLTPIGRDLARLPIDPRIGRMVLASAEEGCLADVLVIASALSVQDPRDRPGERAAEADAAHEVFRDEHSDFMAYLRLWEAYHERARHLTQNKLRQWCKESFVSFVRMREWHDVHGQLAALAGEMGLKAKSEEAERQQAKRRGPAVEEESDPKSHPRSGAVHRALLAGLLSNVMQLADRFEYAGARGGRYAVFPGSALFRQNPRWIVAGELVQTSRMYARTVARVHPGWIERAGTHIVKRTYSEPHWDDRTAQVWAWERVTLFGMELFARRHRHFGPIDPVASRQIFIQRGLVEGRYWSQASYFKRNRALIEEVEALQHRFRRHDLIASMEAQFEFYDKRLPASIYSGSAFEPWLRHELSRDPRTLCMTRADLLPLGVPGTDPDDFPDRLDAGGARFELEYRYEPGHPGDGVTVIVPIGALDALRPERCEWVVPGLLKEKVVALIRTLPKPVRRMMVPAPEFSVRAMRGLEFGRGSLVSALAEELGRLTGTSIAPGDFRPSELAPELLLNIRVVEPGQEGRPPVVLAEGRDLGAVRRSLGDRLSTAVLTLDRHEWSRDGVTAWDWGDLPDQVEVRPGTVGYPAIVDAPDGRSVSLRIVASSERASALTAVGLRRLFLLEVGEQVRFLLRHLPGFERVTTMYQTVGSVRELEDGLAALVVDRAFLSGGGDIRGFDQFKARLDSGWHTLGGHAQEALALAGSVLEQLHALRLVVAGPLPSAAGAAAADVEAQLAALVPPRFLERVPAERLAHLPRYLAAAASRLRKASARGEGRDAELAEQVRSFWLRFVERTRKHESEGVADPALERFRWLIEELRVSLFAQELGTSEPVSVRRLETVWAQVRG